MGGVLNHESGNDASHFEHADFGLLHPKRGLSGSTQQKA
jgi:hypothetical protein